MKSFRPVKRFVLTICAAASVALATAGAAAQPNAPAAVTAEARANRLFVAALAADVFAGPGLLVRFTRAAGGRVDGFTVTTPPARRVRFDKLH